MFNAVAKDVAVLLDDIANIDAYPEFEPLVFIHNAGLDLDGAANRINDARKFGQQPVAGCLDGPFPMPGNWGIKKLAAMARCGC